MSLCCRHGVVYALKFVMRAESVRDYSDLLLSMKHVPNIVIYDYAQKLAPHMNLRCPNDPPFKMHLGRVLEATPENIERAKEARKKKSSIVSFPWLLTPKSVPDVGAHPVSGCSDRYCLIDTFHQGNPKDDKEVLRSTTLVKELGGKVNTQVCEQLHANMKPNNKFLNMMKARTQTFTFRLLLEFHNTDLNNKLKETQRKEFGSNLGYDKFERIVLPGAMCSPLGDDVMPEESVCMEEQEAIETVIIDEDDLHSDEEETSLKVTHSDSSNRSSSDDYITIDITSGECHHIKYKLKVPIELH